MSTPKCPKDYPKQVFDKTGGNCNKSHKYEVNETYCCCIKSSQGPCKKSNCCNCCNCCNCYPKKYQCKKCCISCCIIM